MPTALELTKESTSTFVDLPTMRIHYHDAGSGPVLLMLHGGGPGASGWSNFRQNLPVLTPHFRVLLVDQPGFGLSAKPAHDTPQHELTAKVLLELIDELGIDQVTPVGNSMGGAASLEFALNNPARVDKLILMAPAGGSLPVTSEYPTHAGTVLTSYYSGPGASLQRTKHLVDALTFDGDAVPEELIRERYEAAIEPEAMAYNARMFKNWPTMGPQQWKRIGELTHETLLIWGREDRVLTLDSSLHMLHQMRNARLHVIPNCGHWCQLEARHEFEQQILTFMRDRLE